uniref:Uncharacterized protein n=1 Tax=Setaria viridis TaxID=4556 RepID=A0A4U6VXX4_SETVI|nr:hypothetical protein SEVIR_2G334100v2 [Setaria viridis]
MATAGTCVINRNSLQNILRLDIKFRTSKQKGTCAVCAYNSITPSKAYTQKCKGQQRDGGGKKNYICMQVILHMFNKVNE